LKGIRIIGVGNEMAGDDAVGPAVIEALRGRALPECVELICAGADALGVLEYLEDDVSVVIVDAARMARAPGNVLTFPAANAKVNIVADAWSLHGIGLAHVLKLAEQMRLPARVTIVGIEPASVQPGQGMSLAVVAAIPKAVDSVESIVRSECEAACAAPAPRRS